MAGAPVSSAPRSFPGWRALSRRECSRGPGPGRTHGGAGALSREKKDNNEKGDPQTGDSSRRLFGLSPPPPFSLPGGAQTAPRSGRVLVSRGGVSGGRDPRMPPRSITFHGVNSLFTETFITHKRNPFKANNHVAFPTPRHCVTITSVSFIALKGGLRPPNRRSSPSPAPDGGVNLQETRGGRGPLEPRFPLRHPVCPCIVTPFPWASGLSSRPFSPAPTTRGLRLPRKGSVLRSSLGLCFSEQGFSDFAVRGAPRGHVIRKAETGVRGKEGPFSAEPSNSVGPRQPLDLGLLASVTRRKYSSVVANYLVRGMLLQQPRETNTLLDKYLLDKWVNRWVDGRMMDGWMVGGWMMDG